jgi:class 3 adenylate cyclase
VPSRVLTVMFTDIKGFTERTSQSSRAELDTILDEHEDLLPPILRRFGGTVVKTVGDAFMVTFESPTNAVLCGVMIQDRLHERNEGVADEKRLEVRVAINSGEVVEREGDIFGEAVNIASRIEGITEASEIYFTESVYLAMNKAEVPSSEVGLRRLKGIPEAIKVYRVIQDRHSEQYQQLLGRLRSGAFNDVPVPTTGERRGITRFITRPSKARNAALGVIVGSAVVVAAVAVVAVLTAEKKDASPAADAPGEPAPIELELKDAGEAKVRKDYASVHEALEQGEYGLALARADAMLKEHSTFKESHDAVRDVVGAEIKALVDKGKIEDAMELLEERKGKREYVTFDDLDKDLLLKWGQLWSDRRNFGLAESAFERLMARWPDDDSILRAAVQYAGAPSKLGYTRIGFEAAMKIAADTEGALERDVAETILAGLVRIEHGEESASNARAILAERYEPAAGLLRVQMESKSRSARMNAYVFLKEHDALDENAELTFHVQNLLNMSASDSRDRACMDLAVAYAKEASARPDWAKRKAAIGLTRIEDIRAMGAAKQYSGDIIDLMVEAFAPEIRESVLQWATNGEHPIRMRAYGLLPRLGLDEGFDHWAYHKEFTDLDDYEYQYPYFLEAVKYFGDHAGGERAQEAKQILQAALADMKAWHDGLSQMEAKRCRSNYMVDLKAVEEALAKFE